MDRSGSDHGTTPKFISEIADVFGDLVMRATSPALNRLKWTLTAGAQMAWQINELSTLLERSDHWTAKTIRTPYAHQPGVGGRVNQPYVLGLALINPDEFEQVNQRWGRERGDAVLRETADLIKANIRQSDRVYHYGSAGSYRPVSGHR